MAKINQTIQLPKSNCAVGRGRHKPMIIVDHIADGYYDGTIGWFQNPKAYVSSDFLIARDGRIAQFGRLQDTKYCNYTQATNSYATAYVHHSTSPLVRQLGGNANQYTISIEHEGFYNQTKGRLTPEQLASNIWLKQYIQKEVQRIWGYTIPLDREHMLGHYEINPKGRPNCPGQLFPWAEILKGVAGDDMGEKPYRVRDLKNTPSSQLAAFSNKESAIAMANKNQGYAVFDKNGTLVYRPNEIAVGSLVQVTGTHWATGTKIPFWIKAKRYKVIQLSGRNALLDGVLSWINVDNVKIV